MGYLVQFLEEIHPPNEDAVERGHTVYQNEVLSLILGGDTSRKIEMLRWTGAFTV